MTQVQIVMKLLSFVLAFMTLFASNAVLAESCLSDNDCLRPETYCYTSGECASCTDCTIYKRLPSNGCAKTKNQCGECMPGTEADPNIDGTLSPCRNIGTEHVAADTNKDTLINYVLIAFVIPALIILITILCACWIYRRVKYGCTDNICTLTMIKLCPCGVKKEPEKSATFAAQDPSAPPEPFNSEPLNSDAPSTCTVLRTVVKDENQNASLSDNPCYVRNGLSDNGETYEASESDSLMNNEIEFDETTQPSTWSPGPRNAHSVLDFTNALQQQLHISQPTSSSRPSEQNTSTNNGGSDISINIPHNHSNSGTHNSERSPPTHVSNHNGVNISINVMNNPNVTNNNV